MKYLFLVVIVILLVFIGKQVSYLRKVEELRIVDKVLKEQDTTNSKTLDRYFKAEKKRPELINSLTDF